MLTLTVNLAQLVALPVLITHNALLVHLETSLILPIKCVKALCIASQDNTLTEILV